MANQAFVLGNKEVKETRQDRCVHVIPLVSFVEKNQVFRSMFAGLKCYDLVKKAGQVAYGVLCSKTDSTYTTDGS